MSMLPDIERRYVCAKIVDEFYFRWWENSAIEKGKAAFLPEIFFALFNFIMKKTLLTLNSRVRIVLMVIPN